MRQGRKVARSAAGDLAGRTVAAADLARQRSEEVGLSVCFMHAVVHYDALYMGTELECGLQAEYKTCLVTQRTHVGVKGTHLRRILKHNIRMIEGRWIQQVGEWQ